MSNPQLFEEVVIPGDDPGWQPRREWAVAESRRRRDRGISQVQDNAADGFSEACEQAIRDLARERETFTADDLPERVRRLAHHPNAIGGQIHAAIRAGIIERVGYQQSSRPEAHSRVLAAYTSANGGSLPADVSSDAPATNEGIGGRGSDEDPHDDFYSA